MISITLDTTCIIDLQDNQPLDFRLAMGELLSLAKEHRLDVAVTTRVEGELQHEATITTYRSLIERGEIQIIPSTTRLGYWKLGIDAFPDEELWKNIALAVFPGRDPEGRFRPRGEPVKGYIDIDHLYGHLLSKRDFFITRDGKLLKARDKLGILGIQGRTPQEMVEQIASTRVVKS